MAGTPLVFGADGCPAGWLAVSMPPDAPHHATARIEPRASALPEGAVAVAIDIPIGLMDAPADGPRPADIAARRFLIRNAPKGVVAPGSRVFASPSRAHLDVLRTGGTYADLRGRFPKGQSISKQCFNICPKIMELDDLCRSAPTAPILESHPEIGFADLAGRTLPPKKSAEGRAMREALLVEAGFDPGRLRASLPPLRALWAPDDLLDACMLALTAARIAGGGARGLPNLTDRDSLGLRRVIHY